MNYVDPVVKYCKEELLCKTTNTCIPKWLVCDGIGDCEYDNDEEGCALTIVKPEFVAGGKGDVDDQNRHHLYNAVSNKITQITTYNLDFTIIYP